MKMIEDKSEREAIIEKLDIEKHFDSPELNFKIVRYEKGEFLCQPGREDESLQIIVDGEVNIYHIRDDGSKYFISMNEGICFLGDLEMVMHTHPIYFVEAVSPVTAAVLSLREYREILMRDIKFMNLLSYVLASKLALTADGEAVSVPLAERILNHMKYHCEGGLLKGLGKTAFRLHCSERQLQRILNSLEERKLIIKCGKGAYRLL